MKSHLASIAVLAALLAGCAGGGGSGVPTATSAPVVITPAPQPSPTASAPLVSSFALHIIGFNVSRTIVVPTGATVALPPGYTLGSPVANAIITYPDGTLQQADATGVFTASQSAYAQKYAGLLQSSAAAQPVVKVADPLGGSRADTVPLLPFATTIAGAPRLGGISLRPSVAEAFSNHAVTLIVAPTDVDDRVTGLGSAQIAWSSALGATITPIAGTNQATYLAPNLQSGSQTDTVTATVTVPGSNAVYSATSSIQTLSPAAGFQLSGTVADAGGNAAPGATAIFVANDPPRAYPSFNFSALADASGAYSLYLPPQAQFGLALVLPTNAQSVFPAASAGNGSIQTGGAGTSGSAAIQALASGEFDDGKDDANNAIPDPVVSVRDGWLAYEMTAPEPFWADSGVLALLAGTHTDGAAPAPVGSGLFAQWCYQWQARSGVDTLVLIENAASTCTAAGNAAFEVTAATNGYAFAHYRHLNGAYALGSILDDTTGAQLTATGTWTQTVSANSASVTITSFGAAGQPPSNPQARLSMQYSYTGGTTPQVTLANATLLDPVSGITLASASGTLTQQAAPAQCVGHATACYSGSLAISRTRASLVQAYGATVSINGDGSATDLVRSQASGDGNTVSFNVASAASRAQGSCIVCAGAPALQLDVDGSSELASFLVSAGESVTYTLLSTVEGDAPGQPLAALTFPL